MKVTYAIHGVRDGLRVDCPIIQEIDQYSRSKTSLSFRGNRYCN